MDDKMIKNYFVVDHFVFKDLKYKIMDDKMIKKLFCRQSFCLLCDAVWRIILPVRVVGDFLHPTKTLITDH